MRARETVCQYGSGVNDYSRCIKTIWKWLRIHFQSCFENRSSYFKTTSKSWNSECKKVAKDQGVKALKDIVAGQNVKQVLKTRGNSALKFFGQSSIDQFAPGIKSTEKSKKPQSKSRHRTVYKGRKKPSRKNLRFPPDFLSK